MICKTPIFQPCLYSNLGYIFSTTCFHNVVEVCKNRDLGVMDYLVGLYFEAESKRFLNFEYENINYGWIPREQPIDFSQNNDFDLPE